MPNDQAIEIHIADLNSLSLRLQRLHSELAVGERAVFEELLRDTLIQATPDWLAVYHLPPPPIPANPKVPRTPGGDARLLVGGSDGFTAWVGANGTVQFWKPMPGESPNSPG